MKNSIMKLLYHSFVCIKYHMKSFRGGWILTHFFWLDYKERKANIWIIAKTHLRGWSYSDWCILGLTKNKHKHYLSTRDYCSLHPFNGAYSSWIDDKLTLKYVLHGTEAGKYMPNYYYELMTDGRVVGLMDLETKYGKSIDGIVSLLRDKGLLAFKLVKGSLGVGFYRAEYKEGKYWMNDEDLDLAGFKDRLSNLRGYLVTEYLLPHPEFSKLCSKSVGCLRYIVGRRLNGDLADVYSFIRFGTTRSKFVENYNSGGVLAIIHDGRYDNGNILDFSTNQNKVVIHHPDTHVPLKGFIPHWEEIKNAAHTIAGTLPQMTYMGIDFCVTHDDRVKIIEINSLTSLDAIQLDKSIYDTPGGAFFNERIVKDK